MKFICAMLLLLFACDLALAGIVPLPRPRPTAPAAPASAVSAPAVSAPAVSAPAVSAPAVPPQLAEPSQPSACRLRLTPDRATAPSLPPITGPGECEAPDVVRLENVVLPDRRRVAVTPPAILRCTMAEAVVDWVREEAAPRALDLGASLKAVENLTSFDCRGRNGVVGAKLSEHGKANALDINALRLADGKLVELTDPRVSASFREGLRKSACERFTTVLGPGADGAHEDHIHVDLIERRGGFRICEWDIREPAQAAPATLVAGVPLPRARPAIEARPR